MAEIFHIFGKPDGTRYNLILVRYFQQYVGVDIINGDLYFIWNKLQVPVMDIGYCNDTMIYDYQWHRSMVEPEKSHVQAPILDYNYDKPYL